MKEKRFEKPELIIVQFTDDDIITTSASVDEYGEGGDLTGSSNPL